MARILAVDWDGVEVRYALGSVFKDRLVISSVGDAPIEGAVEEVAAAVAETPNPSTPEESSEHEDEEDDDGSEVVETVEKSYIPRMPVADDEEEEEESAVVDPTVVSTVKKKKGESFKTSPIALTLKKLFRERRVGSATICYSVERADVDVMYMTLPNATDAETPELVFNQALRESLTFNETQPLDFTTLGLPETAKKTGFRRVVAVSIARDKLRRIRETLIGASRAPSKIELREPALAEFLQTDFCGVNYDVPVMLIQELCDEVNLTLGYGKNILYFRSFKVRVDSTLLERAERIRDEVVRTIAIGVDDLPEDAVVEKVVLFTNTPSAQVAENEDGAEVDEAPETLGSVLSRLLAEEEITLDLINPFRISGIKLKCSEPEHVGRYASLIGMLLAERPQARPSIDLLHPHEKPKPPNFTLLFLAYFLVVGILAGVAWGWNKKDLARLNEELDALTKERDEIVMNFNQKSPLANVLTRANNWQNREGVVVLDELRDIAARLPKSPDLVVTRLAYMASYTGSEQRLRNLPVFIISAKITGLEVYKLFENNMKLYGAHNVFSRGPVANPQGGGYKFMFEAFIVCQRRNQQSLLAAQLQEIKAISNNRPEYFVEQEEEKARLLKEAQEKKYGEIVDSLASFMDQIAQEEPKAEPAAEGEEPTTPSLDQLKTFAQQLATRRQNLQQQYANVGNLLRNNAISQERYNQLTQSFKENDAVIVKKWQETCSVINAEEEKIKREQAEKTANTEPTLESDIALRQQLLAQRRQLDYAMQQEQIKLQNGAITQQTYEASLKTYQQEVDKLVAQWNPLMERMKQRQKAQGAPAPESAPAPAPEAQAAPAPEPAPAPAPEAQAAPAPEPAPAPAPEAQAAPAPEPAPAPAPEAQAAPAPEPAPAPAPEAQAAPAPEPAPAPAPAARMEAGSETSLIALAERPVRLCSDLPDSSVKESFEIPEGAVFFEQNC